MSRGPDQPDNSRVEFGERLRKLRESCSDPMCVVAEFLGCDTRTIHEVESGKAELSEFCIARLAKCYGVTVGYLCGEPGAGQYPGEALAARARLRRHLVIRQGEFGFETVLGPRVRVVLRLLMEAAPSYYTLESLGRWSMFGTGEINRILKPDAFVGAHFVSRIAELSGIPETWFWMPDADLGKADENPDLPPRPGENAGTSMFESIFPKIW